MSQMESLSTIRKWLPKKVCRRKVQLSPAVGSRAALGQFEVLEARHMLTASFSSFQDFNSGPDDYGSAATWGDVNNDGFVDVMINDSMWKNNGGTSFTSLGHPVGRGAFGDYNNDGNLDHISAGPKYVSLGNGLGTFAGSFNLPPTPGSPTEAVTWFDMENDGDLDLFIANYGDTLGPRYDTIYRNDGNDTFVHYWTQSGGATNSRGVTLIDYNEDGNMDVYVTRYRLEPNALWENNGAGGFTDVASAKNALGGNGHGIGSAVGDFDNDGHLDIFALNFSHPGNPGSQLLRNTGPSGNYQFEVKSTWQYGNPNWVESTATAAIGDVDNDGDLDLFVSNVYGEPARLYENPGLNSGSASWNFTNVTGASGLPSIGVNLQAAFADFDHDGDLDLVADNQIFQNNTSQASSNNWLRVKLTGDGVLANTTAIGAVVRADLGSGKILTRMVEGATGRGNQNEQVLHFGLGTYSGAVPLEITWPDGTVDAVSAWPNDLAEFTYGGSTYDGPVVDIGEVGQVTNLTHSERMVVLSRTYVNPVVFVQAASSNESQPAVVRVTDVESNSFRMSLQEAANLDGIHSAETVAYVVLEAGSHELPDGRLLEVGTVDTSATVGNRMGNSWGFVSLEAPFSSTPVVLSQIQTTHGSEDYLATRYLSTSKSTVILAMEPAENVTSQVAEETVGYLAIEPGRGVWNEMRYEAGLTPDAVGSSGYDFSYATLFPSAPHLVTSLATYDNSDNAHLRTSNPTSAGVRLKVEEDTTYDSETSHGNEEVAYLAIGGEAMLTARPPKFEMGEVGQITNLTHSVQTVSLSGSYHHPVVIAQPASSSEAEPAVVRVRDVGPESFKISLAEPSNLDGIHSGETVTYVVLEAGTYQMENGSWLEAGTVDTAMTVGNRLGNSWESVSFDADFSTTPVVLSQPQTTHGGSFVKTRSLLTTSSLALLALEQEEAMTTTATEETVGYLAMEPGSGTWGGMRYEAGLTPDAVSHSFYEYSFGAFFESAPSLLASLASYDNSDNGHVRYDDLAVGSVRLKIEEDTTYDSETSHSTEEVAYLAIGGTGRLTSMTAPPDPPVADPDFNSDTAVDLADLMIWQRGFGLTGQTGNSQGDADGSGAVDSDDLDVWKAQFAGGSATATSSVAPVAAGHVVAVSSQVPAGQFSGGSGQNAVSQDAGSQDAGSQDALADAAGLMRTGSGASDLQVRAQLEAGLLALLAGSATSAEGDQPAGPVAGQIDQGEPVSDEPLDGLSVDLAFQEQANSNSPPTGSLTGH